MRIDITGIDKRVINKNKQFRPFDETASFYVIVCLGRMEKVGVSSERAPLSYVFFMHIVSCFKVFFNRNPVIYLQYTHTKMALHPCKAISFVCLFT